MPRKTFFDHLKALEEFDDLSNVQNIRRGDDDGEFKFDLVLENLPTVTEITTLVLPGLEDYPHEHTFMFCVSNDTLPEITDVLESSSINGIPLKAALYTLVDLIHKKLANRKNENNDNEEDDQLVIDADDDLENDSDDNSGQFLLDDEMMVDFIAENNHSPQSSVSRVKLDRDLCQRIYEDMAHVKKSGFKLSCPIEIISGARSFVFVSIRIAKLGLSDDTMRAWSVDPSQYLILSVCYADGYCTLEEFIEKSGVGTSFKVGLCDNYCPNMKRFLEMLKESHSKDYKKGYEGPHFWQTSFISASMENLLNTSLASIVEHRLSLDIQWLGSERLNRHIRMNPFSEILKHQLDKRYLEIDDISERYPEILMHDHLQERTRQNLSLPLIAMQYLLRHFVRCTKYCLVCHSELNLKFEALKPYVCENPLCLYQYMALGFGPQIEHEIRSNPEIVDLLISMCWCRAKSSKLKEFPTGMNLKVPSTKILKLSTPTNIENVFSDENHEFHPETAKFIFSKTHCELYYTSCKPTTLKTGDWIVIRNESTNENNLIHAKVINSNQPFVQLSRNHISIAKLSQSTESPPLTILDLEPKSMVTVYKYQIPLDSMSNDCKSIMIGHLLDILPSVEEMKNWLINHPTALLSDWKERLSPAAIGILRWIIASNRACILPVDNSQCIRGMSGWHQFRFAMGAPTKEQKFVESVANQAEKKKNKKQKNENSSSNYNDDDNNNNNNNNNDHNKNSIKFPTIFAWHGSKLHNWHSIIREGLHFDYISSGRSYGNGVYHSLDHQTSSVYSRSGMSVAPGMQYSPCWRQSSLRMQSTIALCEIVNAPEDFVSNSPHIVVEQLDWIQVRYLFVSSLPRSTGKNEHQNTLIEEEEEDSALCFIKQDPNYTPRGNSGNFLKIPVLAMPSNRGYDFDSFRIKTRSRVESESSYRKRINIGDRINKSDDIREEIQYDGDDANNGNDNDNDYNDDAHSVRTTKDDLEIFLDADHSNEYLKGLKLRYQNLMGRIEGSNIAKSTTGFVPGSLDYTDLPLLPPPIASTSTTTKQLQAHFMALKQTQDGSNQSELGWYTDVAQLNNLFQWIVELHSFPEHLPLTKQMRELKIASVVLELRFPSNYPFAPPFIRVIRPRFLPFASGGGGHVTIGGSLCMELLTSEGWMATYDVASVLLQVRMALCSEEPRPAQLQVGNNRDYSIYEATSGYVRACQAHGWAIPTGFLDDIRRLEETNRV